MTLVGLARLKSLHFGEDPSITKRTLAQWCASGDLPAKKIGERWLVDLDRFQGEFDPQAVNDDDDFDYDAAAAALYGKASGM